MVMGATCAISALALYCTLSDDVLLLAPSVSSLQLILAVCEKELHWLDMMINVKKVILSAHRALPQGQMQ